MLFKLIKQNYNIEFKEFKDVSTAISIFAPHVILNLKINGRLIQVLLFHYVACSLVVAHYQRCMTLVGLVLLFLL